MKNKKTICTSIYHKTWFRGLLLVAGVSIFTLGFSFAIGFNIIKFIPKTNIYFNLTVGFLYMFISSFIIHYALDYNSIKKNTHFVCHHCGKNFSDCKK